MISVSDLAIQIAVEACSGSQFLNRLGKPVILYGLETGCLARSCKEVVFLIGRTEALF